MVNKEIQFVLYLWSFSSSAAITKYKSISKVDPRFRKSNKTEV